MSLKNLFSQRVVSSDTVENIEKNLIESKDYISEYKTQKDKFVPKIDFTTASNFVSFGSAEEYYLQSIQRIYNTYPYDGSKSEKVKWNNQNSYLDQYIFDIRYPKTTGYALFSPTGWSSRIGSKINGYGEPTTKEYITIKGGPNTGSEELTSKPLSSLFDYSNKWDTNLNRTSNLGINLENTGSTIEFWLKKDAFNTLLTEKEVIFDLWNNYASSSNSYGRLTLELTGAINPFLLTVQSGTSGFFRVPISSLATSSLSSWHHYAVSLINTSSQIQIKLYVDGNLTNTILTGSSINEINGGITANIGSLYTAPSGTNNVGIGWGKLSGSIDEFRFWKTKRTSEQVGRYWWTNVDGGSNNDDYNTNIGVYYKFNEGITTTSSIDSNVLDYSGRVSNGSWVGYSSDSRATGSAVNTYFAETKEIPDPIIYSTHPLVSALQTELINSGSEYDINNSSYLYHTLPSWVIEEDETNGNTAKKLFQIISSYFDTVNLQIKELNKIKDYYNDLNDESKPYSFSNQLLESNGLITPNLFIDATLLEELLNRNETMNYEEKLYDLKNHIYQNIYNSLISIYKSKGTEKAYRNLLHSYGIDDKLIKINLYANNQEFSLEDSVRTTYKKKKLLDFNETDRFVGTVYQNQISASDWSYISGTLENDKESLFGFTVESNIVFPKTVETSNAFRSKYFNNVSLFGVHTATTSSQTDLTWNTNDVCNFQVKFIKLDNNSNNGYFQLSSSNPYPISTLTSSLFFDVYNNSNWHLSVRLKNNKYPYSNFVSGSTNNSYVIEFNGYNIIGNRVLESFALTSSINNNTANLFLNANKRFYIGSEYQNFTGSIINYTDIKFADFKVWLNYLSDDELLSHARDIENYGLENTNQNYSFYNTNLTNTEIENIKSLILHWNFENVTGSNAGSGNPLLNDASFNVTNLAYNALEESDSRYESWFSNIKYKNYTAKGNFFLPNKTNIIDIDYITQDKIVDPELINSSDTVNVLESNDIVFGKDIKPTEFKILFEKSMYQIISEQMLSTFANILSFNELIGNVYNKYRNKYKDLNHLRELFYEQVQNEPDLDKFIEFYKWFDSSIGIFLNQITPVSAQIDEKLHNIVEETVLKRNKIQYKFPTLEFKTPDPEVAPISINNLLYNWRLGSAPIGLDESEHALWWRERSERSITTSDTNVLNSRNLILSASLSTLTRKYTTPYKFSTDKVKIYGAGTNYHINNKINFLDIATYPHGPVDSDDIINVPANYLFVGVENTSSLLPDIVDVVDPKKKTKYSFTVIHGRDFNSSSLSYSEKLKSDIALPVNFISGTLTDGYQAEVVKNFMSGVIITNLHNDLYGSDKEAGIQGPFTNQWVGGRQSRHVSINRGSDSYTTRPEAWKLLLGILTTGSYQATLGFVGSDYPYPEGNDSEPSFPVLSHKRATYYREETAKRPINIRNIKYSTGSYELGNYSNNYQIVSTFGSTINNRLLRETLLNNELNIGIVTELSGVLRTISDSITGRTDFTLLDRVSGSSTSIIRNRFAAPGGPRYSSRGFLNRYAEELSPYNASSFKNREVIGNSFGSGMPYSVSAVSGAISTGSMLAFSIHSDFGGYVSGSSIIPSLHKTNRNTTYYVKNDIFTTKHDNFYVSHQVPRKDHGYAWIRKSLKTTVPTSEIWEYYAHANNLFTSSNTLTSSVLGYRTGSVSGAVENYSVPQDLVGLNTIIVEPINTTLNLIGTSSILVITSSFITSVPTSSNLFNAMLVHRNGVYGYPTFKQLAYHRNDKLIQYYRTNNTLQAFNPSGTLSSYFEPVVDNSSYPLVVEAVHSVNQIDRNTNIDLVDYVDVYFTYDNYATKFSNEDLMRDLNLITENTQRDSILLSASLPHSSSNPYYYEPIKIIYTKSIFPISNVSRRKRSSFIYNNWRDSQNDRIDDNYQVNSSISILTASIWPLDGRLNYSSTSASFSESFLSQSSEGLLQNLYTLRYTGSGTPVGLPIYYYKQSVPSINSTKSPSGISDFILPRPTSIDESVLFANSTKWQVTDDTGYKPFYDSYDQWINEAHKQFKNYAVLPEYIISNKIETYLNNNFSTLTLFENYLEVTGASINSLTSSNDLSTAAYIEKIIDENYSTGSEINIEITCNTLEKFLPYTGFYPAERTVALTNAFSSSYWNYINALESSSVISPTSSQFNKHYRTLISPLFAPGILYNTIKSGIAVDYPVITASLITASVPYSIASTNNAYQIANNNFDLRLPFETIINPDKYLNNIRLIDNNPHPEVHINSTASLDAPTTNNLYKLMINNFLAETTNLFLKNSTPSYLRSKEISTVRAEGGKRYQALLKIYKTTNNNTQEQTSNYPRPQFSSSAQENITMFSNPLGFGPPCGAGNNLAGTYTIGTKDGSNGYNSPFTPPYYDGEAWAIIEFVPNSTKTYTLDEIIGSSSVKYVRYEFTSNTFYSDTRGITGPQGSPYMNNNAMQVSASLNIFNILETQQLETQTSDLGAKLSYTSQPSDKKVWEISSKFETPILNFHPTYTGKTVVQSTGSELGLANAGIWLQYGVLPTSDQGIFMQITDVPDSYVKFGTYGASGSITNTGFAYNDANGISTTSIRSLVDLVGFSTDPVRMGELADNKSIKEAIIVIPYTISDNNQRLFLKLNKTAVDNYLNNATIGTTLSDITKQQIDKIQNYVLPPHLDFINNSAVEPFALYVFEIEKQFDKTDLSNIWQNVLPPSLEKVQNNSYTISHKLGSNELLSTLNVDDNSTIKFMCFKVKQRAITKYEFANYNDVQTDNTENSRVIGNAKNLLQNAKNVKKFTDLRTYNEELIGFNWPYDYCSLVESAKIDAKVTFYKFNPDEPLSVSVQPESGSVTFNTPQDLMGTVTISNNGMAEVSVNVEVDLPTNFGG